jgi:hypothetical protein
MICGSGGEMHAGCFGGANCRSLSYNIGQVIGQEFIAVIGK